MKKLIALSFIFAIFSSAAFAEITMSGGVGAKWVPLQYFSTKTLSNTEEQEKFDDGSTSRLITGIGRGDGGAYQGSFSVKGQTDDGIAGFSIGVVARKGSAGPNTDREGMFFDGVSLWLKPIVDNPEFLVIKVDDGFGDLEGKVGDSGDWRAWTVESKGGGEIFPGFSDDRNVGFFSKPVEGLTLGLDFWGIWGVTNDKNLLSGSRPWIGQEQFSHALQRIQIAAGYEIAGVGLIRAGYFGNNFKFNEEAVKVLTGAGTNYRALGADTGVIGAAFALTMVDNLTVDLGFKYPLAVSDPPVDDGKNGGINPDKDPLKYKDTTIQNPLSASLGVKYVLGDVTIPLRVDGYFGKKFSRKIGGADYEMAFSPDIWFYAWPSCKMDIWTFGLELGLIMRGDVKANAGSASQDMLPSTLEYGFGLWCKNELNANTSIKFGIAYSGGAYDGIGKDGKPKALNGASAVTVPVIFNMSF
jgi:hypothetical protein